MGRDPGLTILEPAPPHLQFPFWMFISLVELGSQVIAHSHSSSVRLRGK